MDEIQEWNFKELAEVFCKNNGTFNTVALECNCDMGYFGISCSKSGLDIWGGWWTALQVVFTIMFGFMTIILGFQMKNSIFSETGSFFRIIYRFFSSPKYVVTWNLFVISISRKISSSHSLRVGRSFSCPRNFQSRDRPHPSRTYIFLHYLNYSAANPCLVRSVHRFWCRVKHFRDRREGQKTT